MNLPHRPSLPEALATVHPKRVELVVRPAPDTAPMTIGLPSQSGQQWTRWQVLWALFLWLTVGAICLLLIAAVGLLVGAFVVLALVLLAQWVSPPYVVAGLALLAALFYIYRYQRGDLS